jgi:hypothetical protein
VTDEDLKEAGERAVAEAQRLWALDVYDPPMSLHNEAADRSRKVIDEILTIAGWLWEVPYRGDTACEWCGLFAAACWHAAGIDPCWLATYFASTYRLDIWARYQSFNGKHPNPKPPDGPYRLIANLDAHSTRVPWMPRAGDILMIGDGVPEYGDHITIVESYDPATMTFMTLSGNGVGLGPDGKHRQGIVRATAHVGGGGYCARRLIRPAPGDLL